MYGASLSCALLFTTSPQRKMMLKLPSHLLRKSQETKGKLKFEKTQNVLKCITFSHSLYILRKRFSTFEISKTCITFNMKTISWNESYIYIYTHLRAQSTWEQITKIQWIKQPFVFSGRSAKLIIALILWKKNEGLKYLMGLFLRYLWLLGDIFYTCLIICLRSLK